MAIGTTCRPEQGSAAPNLTTTPFPTSFSISVIPRAKVVKRSGRAHSAITQLRSEAQTVGSPLCSVRHEFPSEWAKLRGIKIKGEVRKTAELTLSLREEHYPLWSRNRLESVKRVDVIAKADVNTIAVSDQSDGAGNKDDLTKDSSLGGLLAGRLTDIPLPPSPVGKFTLYFNNNSMDELWLALRWGKA